MIALESAQRFLERTRQDGELVRFANALVNETDDLTLLGVLLNDPARLAPQYVAWVGAGRPATGFLAPRDTSLDIDWEEAHTAFLAETLGTGESRRINVVGGADRALAVREDALAERRLDS